MKDTDEKIIKTAKKRFETVLEMEKENRDNFLNDLKFANGDSLNQYQWDSNLLEIRRDKPCLTINKVKKHNRQITNEARQNRAAIKVYPVDDNADKDTAKVFNGLIMHIESNSSADFAYDTAMDFSVDGGIGYWRITTDYIDSTSSDQEIYIEPVLNPLSVLEGPKRFKRGLMVSDYVFIADDYSRDRFESEYPNLKYDDLKDSEFVDESMKSDSWVTDKTIRLSEYYYTDYEHDELITSESGDSIKLSEIPKEERDLVLEMPGILRRKIKIEKIKWVLIAGDKIIDSKDWAGSYIPIVRLVGNEIFVDGKVERKGHTRQQRDSQLMYNYYASTATEYVALQGKQPYVAPAEAIAGLEKYWNQSNIYNGSVLPWNHIDSNGQPVPKPERQEPPVMAQAYIQGMTIASQDMIATTGQENAQFGKGSADQSGIALNALQSKSETSTYHFADNKTRAKKFTGVLLVDLIPKIYDTKRVARILGEDGAESTAEIDPNQPQSKVEMDDGQGGIRSIYNLGVGTYDVTISTGADYGTRRREGATMMTDLAGRNPQLMGAAGDLIMKMFDIPYADEVAERLKRAIPPEITGGDDEDGGSVPPKVQQQMQAMQQESEQYKKMMASLDDVVQKMSSELESKEIDRYKAETDRLKVTQEAMTPEQIQAIVLQTLNDLATPDGANIEQQQPLENPMDGQQ